MTRFRKLLLVGVGAIALGVQACSSGTELNPQPLPPADPARGPADQKGTGDNGSSGTSGTAPESGADAGAEGGDAADGGGDR